MRNGYLNSDASVRPDTVYCEREIYATRHRPTGQTRQSDIDVITRDAIRHPRISSSRSSENSTRSGRDTVAALALRWRHGIVVSVTVAEVAGRRQLRSASRGLLDLPRFNMSNYGRRRAFSFAGPHTWNLLPDQLYELQPLGYFQTLAEYIFI